jgi:WD40 repeat protein
MSHKNFVSDIAFIPEGVKVDRRNPPPEGKVVHFISISEDGVVNIWDSRQVEKDVIKNNPEYAWKPYI